MDETGLDVKLTRDRKGYDYTNKAFVGKGSYGEVYLFERQQQVSNNPFTQFFYDDLSKTKYCAIKKYKLPDRAHEGVLFSTLRQLNFMLIMKHPNVVTAHEVFQKNGVISVVMDFHLQLQEVWHQEGQDQFNKKLICYHIAKGLAYLHRYHIMHRDLKPENIFVSRDGYIRIGDFGMSKQFGTPNQRLTPDVCTIYYRAPQLFFSTNYYTQKTDIWSLGCLFYYVLTGQHLFFCNSTSQITVLSRIFSVAGVPNQKDWKGYRNFPKTYQFKPFQRRQLSKQKGLDPQICQLIQQCLALDPKKRPSASEVLQSQFFKDTIFNLDERKLEVKGIFDARINKLLGTQ